MVRGEHPALLGVEDLVALHDVDRAGGPGDPVHVVDAAIRRRARVGRARIRRMGLGPGVHQVARDAVMERLALPISKKQQGFFLPPKA